MPIKCPIVRVWGSFPKRLYYVHYEGQFLGSVAGRSIPDAFKKARNKFWVHIISDPNLLEVCDSGKFEGQ